jgi:hypothetical protein
MSQSILSPGNSNNNILNDNIQSSLIKRKRGRPRISQIDSSKSLINNIQTNTESSKPLLFTEFQFKSPVPKSIVLFYYRRSKKFKIFKTFS